MWPDRRLLELFQIEHPLVLAPMAGFGTVELAAAVSNASGLVDRLRDDERSSSLRVLQSCGS